MSIKGKTESISRFVGSILILISIVLEMCLSILILNNLLINLMLILTTVPPFVVSIFLKLEKDFFVKNARVLSYLLLIELIVLNSIIIAYYNIFLVLSAIRLSNSIILLIICWHFSLSIYKKNKIIFFICGTCFVFLNLPLFLDSISFSHLFIINLILIISVSLGCF